MSVPARLETKEKFSNYVLGVSQHQNVLAKLSKKKYRISETIFDVTLAPDECAELRIIRVYIGKKQVGFLRNNIGYRYFKEIGPVTTQCSGQIQKNQIQDDGSIVDFGLLLNCKTPFAILYENNQEIKPSSPYRMINRLFQQSHLDTF